MILKGNQRGGAKDLAVHLMKPENEHVDVHEIRGFSAETVSGALNEAYAMSRATKCRQFMYSLSANPPPDKQVGTDYFIDVIDRAEKELGLEGQPRAIVFHEKQGRRHAHCVWSRIIPDEMKAVHLPFPKKKLVNLTRDIFIERGWDMPRGLVDRSKRDPLQFNLAEYQQAKRLGKNPRDVKADFQNAWAISDSLSAFKNAMREKGYWLAKGDRRGFVALDHTMTPHAVSKWLGLKARAVREKLGKPDGLPSIEQTSKAIAQDMDRSLTRIQSDVKTKANLSLDKFEEKRLALVKQQQTQRALLKSKQNKRQSEEAIFRQSRFRRGMGGLWDKARGEHKRIQKQNMSEAYDRLVRDRHEMDAMIFEQIKQRQRIDIYKTRLQERAHKVERSLERDKAQYHIWRRDL